MPIKQALLRILSGLSLVGILRLCRYALSVICRKANGMNPFQYTVSQFPASLEGCDWENEALLPAKEINPLLPAPFGTG